MTNAVLDRESLPQAILRIVNTDKVHFQEKNGEIRITPLREGSGLLGLGAGLNFSTERFNEMKREDKSKEKEQLGE